MKKTITILAFLFVFLAGMVAGVVISLAGLAPIVDPNFKLEDINPIFLLSNIYYYVGIVILIGLAALFLVISARLNSPAK